MKKFEKQVQFFGYDVKATLNVFLNDKKSETFRGSASLFIYNDKGEARAFFKDIRVLSFNGALTLKALEASYKNKDGEWVNDMKYWFKDMKEIFATFEAELNKPETATSL